MVQNYSRSFFERYQVRRMSERSVIPKMKPSSSNKTDVLEPNTTTSLFQLSEKDTEMWGSAYLEGGEELNNITQRFDCDVDITLQQLQDVAHQLLEPLPDQLSTEILGPSLVIELIPQGEGEKVFVRDRLGDDEWLVVARQPPESVIKIIRLMTEQGRELLPDSREDVLEEDGMKFLLRHEIQCMRERLHPIEVVVVRGSDTGGMEAALTSLVAKLAVVREASYKVNAVWKGVAVNGLASQLVLHFETPMGTYAHWVSPVLQGARSLAAHLVLALHCPGDELRNLFMRCDRANGGIAATEYLAEVREYEDYWERRLAEESDSESGSDMFALPTYP